MFDVTNEQSFINLVSDEDNSRKIRRSWMKELMFKSIGDKHPVMVLGKLYIYIYLPATIASKKGCINFPSRKHYSIGQNFLQFQESVAT